MKDLRASWATVPTADGPDEWWVLDIESGQLRGRAPLQCHAAGSQVVAHPDNRYVGLSVGEGRDGSELYWGCRDNGQVVVSRVDDRSRVLIIAGSVESETHVLLAAGTLKLIANVEHPERAVRQGLSPTGRATWLTRDYVEGLHQVWRLVENA